MATSRSSNPRDAWIAGVSLYSGRPDPVWRLPAPAGRQLEALWEALAPLGPPAPEPPPLGYRGCFATGPHDRRWVAYRGAVTLRTAQEQEIRSDSDRAFERFIVESAPAGALPARARALMDLPDGDE